MISAFVGPIFFLLILLNTVIAGQYELMTYLPAPANNQMFEISPKNMDVCSSYEKYLNSPPIFFEPLVCGHYDNKEYSGFERPNWEILDVNQNRSLIYKFDKELFWKNYDKWPYNGTWESRFNERLKEGPIILRKTKIDVLGKSPYTYNLDGIAETVIEYDYGGNCDPKSKEWKDHGAGKAYFYVGEDNTRIRVVADNINRIRDAILYKGKVYFIGFSNTDWDEKSNKKLKSRRYELWLYAPSGAGRVSSACRFKYIDSVKKKNRN